MAGFALATDVVGHLVSQQHFNRGQQNQLTAEAPQLLPQLTAEAPQLPPQLTAEAPQLTAEAPQLLPQLHS